MRALFIATLLVFATCSRTASAEPRKLDFLLEVGNGLAIPIGGDTYTRLTDPSYEAQLRFALGIPIVAGLRLGPCLQLAGMPVNTDDSTLQNRGIDARFGRARFLVGADVRYRVIERLDLFLRFSVGLDYLGGSIKVLGVSQDSSSTVFGFEPAVGATVRVWKMLTVGLSFGFPFAVNHTFGGINTQFNAADFDLQLLAGARF